MDCIRDVEVIETELLLKDADTVTKVLEGLAYVCAGMRGKWPLRLAAVLG